MITDLKPYSATKDSGVEWLGEVPEHWGVLPNRALFYEINTRDYPDEEMLSVTIKRGVVKQSLLLQETSKKDSSNLDRSKYKLVKPGDVVYNKMRAWQGAIGVSKHRGIVSPAYIVQHPHDCSNPNYFHQLFRTPSFAKEAERWSYGIASDMWSLRPEHFKLIHSCLPPIHEQAAIVRYLNYVNSRIRGLVWAKHKLIKLLEEHKRAIINQAVTRGIDNNVPLKDSGVEWLKKVPAHWEISRVKREFTCKNPSRIPLSATVRGEMTSRQYDYYGASGVIDKVDDYIFDDELLLIAEDGANLVLRNLPLAIIARGKFWVNNHAHILKPKRGNLEYLAGVMESLNYRPWISGAAQPKLTKDRLMGIAIAVPPPDEQEAIVTALEYEIAPIRSNIAQTQREIKLINEYRNRLIADVVTGKYDIRDASKALPETDAIELENDDLLETNDVLDLDDQSDVISEKIQA